MGSVVHTEGVLWGEEVPQLLEPMGVKVVSVDLWEHRRVLVIKLRIDGNSRFIMIPSDTAMRDEWIKEPKNRQALLAAAKVAKALE